MFIHNRHRTVGIALCHKDWMITTGVQKLLCLSGNCFIVTNVVISNQTDIVQNILWIFLFQFFAHDHRQIHLFQLGFQLSLIRRDQHAVIQRQNLHVCMGAHRNIQLFADVHRQDAHSPFFQCLNHIRSFAGNADGHFIIFRQIKIIVHTV